MSSATTSGSGRMGWRRARRAGVGVGLVAVVAVNVASAVVVAESMRMSRQSGVLLDAVLGSRRWRDASESNPPRAEPQEARPASPEDPPSRSPSLPAGMYAELMKRGRGARELPIDRATAEALLSGRAARARASRVPSAHTSSDDVLHPLQVKGATPGSLLAAIGLRDGDLLWAVNGFPLASPEQALEAYARLRDASVLELWLTRKGRAEVYRYIVS